jgi:hypothetical protein
MERFLHEVAPVEAGLEGPQAPGRCARCFSMRLSRTAVEACRLGVASFTTTLLVSPYQDQELLREAGESAAMAYGLNFIFEDMSAGFGEASSRSRESGMYRQSYCGCVYSEKERYQKGDPPRR